MPDTHALLGPSGAHRWLVCTPSARLEESLEDKGSTYAEEGTLAHRMGELLLREQWEGADITADLQTVFDDPLYSAAMGEHLDDYVTFVAERMAEAKTRCPDPLIFIEAKLDYREYVPEGFGTADCIIIADGLMDVIDFKYGVGVPVSAENNPQMKLYALAGLLALGWAYDVDAVQMTIYQPRIGGADCALIRAKDLLDWAETELRPIAAQAWEGVGEFCPGDHQCKWCRFMPKCRPHRDWQMELARHDFANPAEMTAADIAEIVLRQKSFENWIGRVKAYAEDCAINHGEHFPGLKVVEGRSDRMYADEAAIAKTLNAAGYKPAEIFKPKELIGLGNMEKLLKGRKRFDELLGAYIAKPSGKPALVPTTDKRPELNTAAKAAEDFAEVPE